MAFSRSLTLLATAFTFIKCGLVTAVTECQLSDPIAINDDEDLYLQHVKNTQEGTYTMKLTYLDGQAWIGIGINSNGDSKMTPATAVIGRADNGAGVQYYSLTSDSKDGSGVQPFATSSLKDATFQQDATTSVLTFTQELSEMGVTDESSWIFAVGLPDNAWEGKHKIHGSFQLSLSDEACTTSTVTEPPTFSPTSLPTQAPTEKPVEQATDADMAVDNDEEEDTVLSALSTTTLAPTFQSETQPESQSLPMSPRPTVSPMATPSLATITEEPVPLVDPNFFATINSNTGTSSSSSGLVRKDTTHPDKALWMAHGILLAVAWGICAPLGIGASILRDALSSYGGGNWYSLHFYLNMLTVVLTAVGFLLGVVATQREGKEHFQGDAHHKAGLAIMVLVLVQALAGYFRPGMPKAKPPSPATQPDVELNTSVKDVDMEETSDNNSSNNEATSMPTAASEDGNNIGTKTQDSSLAPPTSPNKSMVRFAWEWSHRLCGVVLLGLAWYNCHTGIALQVENWEEIQDGTTIFWGITAGISGGIFVLAYVIRV